MGDKSATPTPAPPRAAALRHLRRPATEPSSSAAVSLWPLTLQQRVPPTSSKANFSGRRSVSQTMKLGEKTGASRSVLVVAGEDLVALVERLALELDPLLDPRKTSSSLSRAAQPGLRCSRARGRAATTRARRSGRRCSGSSRSRRALAVGGLLLVGVEGERAVDAVGGAVPFRTRSA